MGVYQNAIEYFKRVAYSRYVAAGLTSNVDLLVIDEIGMQTESRYEKVIINQIVDRRSSSKRPTGMLTNSNMDEMTKLLGERVMDRMRLGNSLWVIFNWESYRSRVTGKEY